MQSINISLYNNTLLPKEIKTDIVNNQNILDNPDEYEVSVMKLNIPSSNLQTFKISNKADYSVRMTTYADSTRFSNSPINVKYSLPNDTDDLLANTSYGKIYYHSEQSLIDALNRTIYRCYKDTVQQLNNTSQILSFKTASLASTGVNYDSFSVATTATRLSYIEFTLGAVQSITQPFNISLTSPSGQTAIVYHFIPSEFNLSQITTSNYITFTDASYKELDPSETLYQTNTIRIPAESFLNLINSTTIVNGNWKVGINCDATNWNIQFSYNLKIVTDPYAIMTGRTYPNIPANFSLNSSNMLTFNYAEGYRYNNIKFGFSSKLKNIFNMGNINYTYMTTTSDHEFKYPSFNYSSSQNNVFTLTQQISSKYLMKNLDRIILQSSLPIEPELYNSGQYQGDVMADFLIDNSTDLDILDFSPDYSIIPARRFKLLSKQPLRSFSLSASAIYKDNQTSPVLLYMSAGESFYCRLSFFKTN